MNETDIPCSDCGMALVEQSVHAQDLPVVTDVQDDVRIAACPSCGARYYPKQTLSRLAEESPGRRSQGDS